MSSNFCSEGASSLAMVRANQEPCTSSIHEENGVWCELSKELASKLSPSMVSLASFDGETLYSQCTGIVIATHPSSAFFLTSGSLFPSSDDTCRHTFTIKVLLPNGVVVDGWLACYIATHSLLVVCTEHPPPPDLNAAHLTSNAQVELATKLLAVRRCFKSCKLMATNGSPIGDPQFVVDKSWLKLTMREISKAAIGGPLVDFDGNIVGMGYYCEDTGLAALLPRNFISECSLPFVCRSGSNQDGSNAGELRRFTSSQLHYKKYSDEELQFGLAPWPSTAFTESVNKDLMDYGYPLPKYCDNGMHLKGVFEEEFDENICNEHVQRVASKISRSVVALASFNEEGRRYFACTGVFIECNGSNTRVLTSASLVRTSGDENKVHDNMRIEVCLPSKRHVEGTLQHYNIQYNVAVVTITGVRRQRAAKLSEAFRTEVIALGCGFKSGRLMATNGVVTDKRSRFDCRDCAGIGGPLVDLDGNFVGMNFYDMKETPYLPRNIILDVLGLFDAERTVAAGTADMDNFIRWPVPDPYWVYPSRQPKVRKLKRCVLL